MSSNLRRRLNEADVLEGDPARTYVLLLDIFSRILDTAESEGRDLTAQEKDGLNKVVPWLMHGNLRAARDALDTVLARPDDIAANTLRNNEILHLGELTIADFRRALKHLNALEPWM